MKKRMMNRKMRLVRPADGLLPLAWMAGYLLGPDTLKPAWIFFGWFATRLCALFTADAVRMAYATQPGRRSVRGSTTAALLIQIAGMMIACGIYAAVFRGITPFMLCIFGVGTLLNIEHVFYEYLYAAGDKHSAGMLATLTAALVGGGMCVEQPGLPYITLGAAGLSALVGLIAACGAGYKPDRMNIQVFRRAPRAVIYGIFYPALALGAVLILKQPHPAVKMVIDDAFGGVFPMEITLWMGFFAGYILHNLCYTAFRRSRMESGKLNTAVLLQGLGSIILWGYAMNWGKVSQWTWMVKAADFVPGIAMMILISAVTSGILWCDFKCKKD